jgi:hypothetical protein
VIEVHAPEDDLFAGVGESGAIGTSVGAGEKT